MTYQEWAAIIEMATPAQARIGSVLRGGHVFDDKFYFMSSRPEVVELSSVRELQYRNAEGKYD